MNRRVSLVTGREHALGYAITTKRSVRLPKLNRRFEAGDETVSSLSNTTRVASRNLLGLRTETRAAHSPGRVASSQAFSLVVSGED
jgi:hypothetical protein